MKKLLLTLLCLLTVSAIGFSKTLTIEFNSDVLGNTTTTYVKTAWSFTVDGVKFNINQTNPTTGQIQMNKAPGSGFAFFNEVALPGDIESVALIFSEANAEPKAPNNLYFNLGDAALADVQSTGTTGTWDADTKTATWTVTDAGKKYFRFDCNTNTGGTNKVTKMVITYKAALLSAGMSFMPATAEATVGELFEAPELVKATDAAVTYSSDNTTVATVDATTGIVTALAEGKALITATAEANDTYEAGTASYTLTVKASTTGEDPIPDTPTTRKDAMMYFTPGILTVTYGTQFSAPQLTKATNAPVFYSAKDETVAKPNPATGELTLTGAGTTLITATAPANAEYLAGEAFYILTVERAAGKLTFSTNAVELTFGDKFVAPSLAHETDGTITWTSSRESVATVDANGKVTIVGAGTTTITASAAQSSLYTAATASYTITVNEALPEGSVEIKMSEWGTSTEGFAQDVAWTKGNFTFTASKADGQTNPGYNAGTQAVRIYAKGTLNIKTVDGANMTGIIFKLASDAGYRYTTFTPNTGAVSEQKLGDTEIDWTGAANNVTFTVGESATLGSDGDTKAGQIRIASIILTTGEGGDTPGPVEPGDGYATLADFMTAKPAENATLNADLTAVYQNGKDLFVTSGGAYALVYGQLDNTYNNGDVIKAPVEGKYDEYNAVPEFIPVASTFTAGVAGTAVAAQAVEISSLTTADFGKYVRLEGVTIEADASNARSFTATDGTSTVTVWNRWNKSVTVEAGTDATIYGFIGINKPAEGDAVVNIWPVRVEVEGGGDTPDEPVEGSYIVFDIENPGTWTAEGTGFTRTNTVNGKEFTITTDKGSSSTALISPDANSYAWRVYKGSKFTLSAADLNMTKIVITYDDYTTSDGKGYASELVLSDGWTGTLDGTVYTITGSGSSLTATAEANQVRIKKIVVESGEGGGDTPDEPTSESVTFDFTKPETLTPAQDMPTADAPVIVNGVTFTNGPISCVTVNTGSVDTRDPRLYLYKEACEFRFYEDNTTTISGEGVTIEKIEFICQYPSNFDVSTANCGTFANAVWTGEAQSVEFTWHKGDYSPKTNQIKVTYTKGAGIDDVAADYSDAPVEYYNLQGVRVANPAPGMIVIRRQGNNVSKILVK